MQHRVLEATTGAPHQYFIRRAIKSRKWTTADPVSKDYRWPEGASRLLRLQERRPLSCTHGVIAEAFSGRLSLPGTTRRERDGGAAALEEEGEGEGQARRGRGRCTEREERRKEEGGVATAEEDHVEDAAAAAAEAYELSRGNEQ